MEWTQTVWQCSSFRSFRLSAWILPKACPPTEGACLSRSIDPSDEWSSVGHTPCKTSAVGQTQSRAARTSQEQLVRRSASQWGPNGEQSLYLVICESRTPDFSGPWSQRIVCPQKCPATTTQQARQLWRPELHGLLPLLAAAAIMTGQGRRTWRRENSNWLKIPSCWPRPVQPPEDLPTSSANPCFFLPA